MGLDRAELLVGVLVVAAKEGVYHAVLVLDRARAFDAAQRIQHLIDLRQLALLPLSAAPYRVAFFGKRFKSLKPVFRVI